MSLISAAFAKTTMSDNNAMHQTSRKGVALAPRRGLVVEARLQVDCECQSRKTPQCSLNGNTLATTTAIE
jgi:hypothetical protein